MKSYFSIQILILSLLSLVALTSAKSTVPKEDEEPDPYQASKDAIAGEWKKICDAGCQPGTRPGDATYLSDIVLPELIDIQYKPNCSAASIHLSYYREIFECGGRRDLCDDLDKGTTKCRAQVTRKLKSAFGQLADEAECERDGSWQDEYYMTARQFIGHFYHNICGRDVSRQCTLTGDCISPANK